MGVNSAAQQYFPRLQRVAALSGCLALGFCLTASTYLPSHPTIPDTVFAPLTDSVESSTLVSEPDILLTELRGTSPSDFRKASSAEIFQRGAELQRAGRAVEAVKYYREILQRRPRHVGALVNLGIIYFEAGNLRSAMNSLQQAIRETPQNTQAHLNLGVLHLSTGNTHFAHEEFLTVLSLDPDNTSAHINLGLIYQRWQNHSLASHHLQEAVKADPDNPLAHYNFGRFLDQRGEGEKALYSWREFLRLMGRLSETSPRYQSISRVVRRRVQVLEQQVGDAGTGPIQSLEHAEKGHEETIQDRVAGKTD